MVSKYSIIQYAPNPISGERINIGVIAFDNLTAKVSFVRQWRRIKSFAGEDVEFLKELAQEFTLLSSDQLSLPGAELGPKLNEELISQLTSAWANCVQITTPRTSLKSVDDLLAQTVKQFLRQPAFEQRPYRDRKSAASIAKATVRKAIEDKVGKDAAEKYFHPQREVNGKYGPHTFDVVISNGSPKVAVQGVSFELPQATQLDQLVDAVAFQVFDILEAHPNLSVGILALPPTPKSHSRAKKTYDRARATYEGLHAEVIEEKDAEAWARRQVDQVPI